MICSWDGFPNAELAICYCSVNYFFWAFLISIGGYSGIYLSIVYFDPKQNSILGGDFLKSSKFCENIRIGENKIGETI